MGRVREIRTLVERELAPLDEAQQRSAFAHLFGVSLACGILARKRGVSVELAQMAALLHDLAAYKSGSYDDHAKKSADMAATLLRELGQTSHEESEAICTAIRNHDDKDRVDGPLDEVLKDADVLQHTLQDPDKAVKAKEKARYEALAAEFGFCS